jgi:hypothetical protein
MSECHCIIKHTTDPEHRSQAIGMLSSPNKTEWLIALAMLSPCPTRKEAS